jgi:hypothetical protein
MNTISRIYKSIIRGREVTGRTKAHSALMSMDAKLLEGYGYSPKLLRGGVKNWPWRLTSEIATESHIEGQLKDLSIAKTDIEMALRYGQSQNDSLTERQEIA